MILNNEETDRVKDFGEVFTLEDVVKKMCDLIPEDVWQDVDKTFLEPTCGNGNFLVEILERKLKFCKTKKSKIDALKSIYGVDILEDNVVETRNRLGKIMIKNKNIVKDEIDEILNLNIICGDTLKCVDNNGKYIKFRDWKTGEDVLLIDMINTQGSFNF